MIGAILFGFTAGLATAQEPAFADYPASYYTGPVQTPDLASHPDARTYRTRLREAANGGVNFAGDHVLVTWGCGTQCLMGAVINARSGFVQFLPGTICCWFEAGDDINPIAFGVDSNLLVMTGLLNEQEPLASYYYDFSGREFRLVEQTAPGSTVTQDGSVVEQQSVAKALVCYYDSSGNQHDADLCQTGSQLSDDAATDLGARCLPSIGAYCDIGSSGQCRSGGGRYSQYQIFERETTQGCPPVYAGSGNGDPATVAPTCPDGYRLVDNQCVRQTIGGGSCEASCMGVYDQCAARVASDPSSDETAYEECSIALDQCNAGCAISRGDCYTYSDGARICP